MVMDRVSKLLVSNFNLNHNSNFALTPIMTLNCPYMSPFLSKSPTAKFNATSAGGMQLTAVDVCSPIARLLLNFYSFAFGHLMIRTPGVLPMV